MACQPQNPCYQPDCVTCSGSTDGLTVSGTLDSSQIIYHLTPGEISKLSCVQLGNGVTLTTVLEALDKKLCENNLPAPLSLNLSCLLAPGATVPASFSDVINLLITATCQLKHDTELTYLIGQLLANTQFGRNLAILIANSADFVATLLANTSFLTSLAGNTLFENTLANNSNFVTKLTQNGDFISKLGDSLTQNSLFLSKLVTAITSNPVLKDKFCCGTQVSPCAGMIVNGVTLTDCSCIPPANVLITGPATVAANTAASFTIGYSGTEGLVSWSVTGGTLGVHDNHTASATFTGAGSITATLTGCDGSLYPVTKTITTPCTASSGLTITGTTPADPGTTGTYTATVSSGNPLSYQWSVAGGAILGSATGATVQVTWSASGGSLGLTITDCSGTPKTTTRTLAPSCQPIQLTSINGPTAITAGTTQSYSATLVNGSGATYQWSAQHGTVNGPATTPTVSIDWAGDQRGGSITLLVSGCNGSTATQTLLVTLAVDRNLSTTPTAQPNQFAVSFDDSTTSGPYSYTLTDSNGNPVNSGSL